jgi:TRAP-type C4-dicarboxylate transport system permease small subunit
MIWVFGVGYFTSVMIGLMVLLRLARILAGKVTDRELAIFAGTFEHDDAEHIRRALD